MQQLEAYPFTSVLTYDEHGWPQLDRAVTSEVLRNVLRSYYTNGVFGTTDTSCLQVTADTSGTSVQVAPGTALIQGATGYSESTTILPLSANSNTLPRIDTVVVRLNDNSDYRGIYLDIIEGTPAATPAAPTLTRGDSIWELGLANIYRAGNSTAITNSNITDTRMDPDRCGYTAAAIELDTSAFYNQLQAAYGEYTTYVENLIAELDELIDEGVASGLQAQIDTIDGDTPWYATSSTAEATAAKVATTNDEVFALAAGAKVVVKFDNTNTAAAPTLNVDGTGAKSIKAYGTTAPTVWWKAGDVVSFVYDGTNWIMGVTAGEIEKITGDINQINSDLTELTEANYYSEYEYQCGNWFGLPLYRKVFRNTGTGTRSFNTGIDFSNIRRLEGYLKYGTLAYIIPPYYQANNDWFNFFISSSNCNVRGAGAFLSNPSEFTLIVEYTK